MSPPSVLLASVTFLSSCACAKEMVLKEMPDAQIAVVDTYLASLGLANAVMETKKFVSDNPSLEEAAEFATSISSRTRIVVSVDTLEYLVRGGRIGKARGLVGGLLQIKPILHLIDGEIHPYEQARTTKKARRRLISIVTEQKDHIVGAAVATTTELELANEIGETLSNELNVEEVSNILLIDLSFSKFSITGIILNISPTLDP